ncbi:MAG: CHAD domain-containing protein [Defluviicoccus sp.]|nr:MAG: CHAD domain-containing protein [Defluviicoccus sp.]
MRGQHAALAVSATHIAHELLDAIYQDLLAAGAGFEHLAPAARHKVRIQLKKLRYATEFFSSLYPKRKVTPYLTAMKALQDDLGANNDVDVAKTLLRRALKGTRGKQRTRLSYAAGMVVGWHGHIGDGREQQVIAAWNRLTGRAPYWETQAAVTQAAQTQGRKPAGRANRHSGHRDSRHRISRATANQSSIRHFRPGAGSNAERLSFVAARNRQAAASCPVSTEPMTSAA